MSTATRSRAKAAPVEAEPEEFIKQIKVPVPFGTGVRWEDSDHSSRIGQIKTDAELAGFTVIGEPEYISEELDEDGPYQTGTILNFRVLAKRA